ncbi:MAG: sigma-70 family RNA polymerase sigma factor [Clostridia bacterium]|nr:sigma-70 family RNA polymerase sigma factor [Clostridia bacterium]
MATNEELVVQIKAGNRDKLPELWEQIEAYVRKAAARVIRALQGSPLYDLDDLMQVGYIALEDAIQSFDVGKNCKFTTYYRFKLKTAFAVATGFRTKAQRSNPLRYTISLDAPIRDADGDECRLLDLVQDPVNYEEELINDSYETWKRKMLHQEVDRLPDEQADVIRRRFFLGESKQKIAESMQLSRHRVAQIEKQALQNLYDCHGVWEIAGYVEDHTDYYYHVGIEEQIRSGCSSVEKIVLRRERLKNRQENLLKRKYQKIANI